MPIIYFRVLSIGDAEEAVAETWRVLEEYEIPSPSMMFTFHGRSGVKIALRVDDAVNAQTLMLRLSPLGAVVDRQHGAPAKVQPMRFPQVFRSSIAPSRVPRSPDIRH
jgi:hypothetical protein